MPRQRDPRASLALRILEVSREFAEVCADCEHLRVNEPYPQAGWHDAWARRMQLQTQWANLAKRLTDRPTDPPPRAGTPPGDWKPPR